MKVRLTLAQFKRDASSGHMGLELLERYGKKIDKPVIVPVVKVQTNGVYLKRGNNESFLDYPFASLFEYTGDMLKVYEAGKREPNELEQCILNNWKKVESHPEFQQRARVDALTDGMSTWYQQKAFFDNSACPYLFTRKNGMEYDRRTGKVIDPKIKGECVLVYKVHKI